MEKLPLSLLVTMLVTPLSANAFSHKQTERIKSLWIKPLKNTKFLV